MGIIVPSCGGSPENIKLRILEDKLRKDLAPKNISELQPSEGVISDDSCFYVYTENELKKVSLTDLKTLLSIAAGSINSITINSDGFWVVNGEVTSLEAKGPEGPEGPAGQPGANGSKGDKGEQGLPGIDGKDGVDGINGENGKDGRGIVSIKPISDLDPEDKLRIYEIKYTDDTSDRFIIKDGEDGNTPEIGINGNWFINNVDTGKPSVGEIKPATMTTLGVIKVGANLEVAEDGTLSAVVSTGVTEEHLQNELAKKQNTLIAGDNISIIDDTISATSIIPDVNKEYVDTELAKKVSKSEVKTETWTFTLADGSIVTKEVVIK